MVSSIFRSAAKTAENRTLGCRHQTCGRSFRSDSNSCFRLSLWANNGCPPRWTRIVALRFSSDNRCQSSIRRSLRPKDKSPRRRGRTSLQPGPQPAWMTKPQRGLDTLALSKKSTSDSQTRQKSAKKRSLRGVNEHFESIFNALWVSADIFQTKRSERHRHESTRHSYAYQRDAGCEDRHKPGDREGRGQKPWQEADAVHSA